MATISPMPPTATARLSAWKPVGKNTAITTMAPMSSTIARAKSSTLSPGATRLPSNAKMPTAKAMSVAIGVPQPRLTGVPWANPA